MLLQLCESSQWESMRTGWTAVDTVGAPPRFPLPAGAAMPELLWLNVGCWGLIAAPFFRELCLTDLLGSTFPPQPGSPQPMTDPHPMRKSNPLASRWIQLYGAVNDSKLPVGSGWDQTVAETTSLLNIFPCPSSFLHFLSSKNTSPPPKASFVLKSLFQTLPLGNLT